MLMDDKLWCEEEIAALVSVLLEHNRELICNSSCSRTNETSLYIACERRLVTVVKLLLDAGSVVEGIKVQNSHS